MPSEVKKVTNLDQLKALEQRTKSEVDSLSNRISAIEIPEYTIEKLATPESGYFATYVLKQDDTQVGAKINIPKDFLVRSAAIQTVATADTPYSGAAVGDKYIDFVVNSKDSDDTASHIYLPVNDLVDTYTAGNGIDISGANAVSVKIDATNAHGLSTSASGLALALATPDTYSDGTKTADGAAGALSSADKYKLDTITLATDAEVNSMILEVFGLQSGS